MLRRVLAIEPGTTPDGVMSASYYFRFYLARALDHAGMADEYLKSLDPWRKLLPLHFSTWPEIPGDTRSDSHAWSAHPIYDLLTLVAGIEPASPGFATVRIAPHLGSLDTSQRPFPHPHGDIEVEYHRTGSGLDATITLPGILTGRFFYNGKRLGAKTRSQPHCEPDEPAFRGYSIKENRCITGRTEVPQFPLNVLQHPTWQEAKSIEPSGHVNLRTLAEHLELSQTTVSLVLNNSPSAKSIPQETRNRVLEAATRLNYRPNYFARSLRQSRSMSVGVLAPDLSEGYFTRVMSGVVQELTSAHYFYFTACHDWNTELIEQYPRMLVETRG